MTNATEKIPQKKIAPKTVLPPRIPLRQEYVKFHFPIHADELTVRYTPVGDHSYRIVFFKSVNDNPVMPDPKVRRSYFITVKREKDSWSHKVIDSSTYF